MKKTRKMIIMTTLSLGVLAFGFIKFNLMYTAPLKQNTYAEPSTVNQQQIQEWQKELLVMSQEEGFTPNQSEFELAEDLQEIRVGLREDGLLEGSFQTTEKVALDTEAEILGNEIAALAHLSFVTELKFQDQTIQAFNIAEFNYEKAKEIQESVGGAIHMYLQGIDQQIAKLKELQVIEYTERSNARLAIKSAEIQLDLLQTKYIKLEEKYAVQQLDLPNNLAGSLMTLENSEAEIVKAQQRLEVDNIAEKFLADIQKFKKALNEG